MRAMLYKDFQGLKLSALGMGAMRLPVLEGDDTRIDQPAVEAMVDAALQGGVNYFDTAWGYHGGHSEAALGAALGRYPRDRFYLATKFPGYDLANMDKVRQIFPAQLERCGVDYFDFYLIHNVCEMNIDAYLDPKHGILDYLLRQKAAGRIRHLGFSAHGSTEVMTRFLDAYGQHMEFCQIQLNWLDWSFQEGADKAALLNSRGLPIWVMEPLRGGRLAALSPADTDRLRTLRPEESTPAWAFRFLQGVPGVTVVLSGMSNMAQLGENIAILSQERPLSPAETAALEEIGGAMVSLTAAPCTACRYCTSYCPQGLDIPRLLALYNEHVFTGGGFLAPMALMAIPEGKRPADCRSCHSCEKACPQQIKIVALLADFCRRLGK